MAYGFKLGVISGLSRDIPVLNITLNNGTSNTYMVSYYDGIWRDDVEEPAIVLGVLEETYECVVILIALTSDDVGDEYTINLSLPETATDSFTNATIKAIEKSEYPLFVERSLYDDSVTTVFDSQTSTYRASINEQLEGISSLYNVTVLINELPTVLEIDNNYAYFKYSDESVGIAIAISTSTLAHLWSDEAGTYTISITAKGPNMAFINAVKSALNIPAEDGEYVLDITGGVISWKTNK